MNRTAFARNEIGESVSQSDGTENIATNAVPSAAMIQPRVINLPLVPALQRKALVHHAGVDHPLASGWRSFFPASVQVAVPLAGFRVLLVEPASATSQQQDE